ncbi:hypothetical protein RLW55_08180 [Hyphomicrobium sp. B1]|jgi:hypothetical protein|uniref:hypothetical protein n=1 Tax=unclassified Hyphomicrobium TaxID=2619925 RepID=UPI000213EDB4|nr:MULTISPECIES: hypothetical protein [unclassified Hyphomicrobium]CCB67236.1 protein of unknown function [Hyphomicrobium sp. MC1]
MSNEFSNIKPAEIYADLSADDIAEMMAEAAAVDALFQSGHASTTYLSSLSAAAFAVAKCEEEVPEAPATAA